MPDPIVKFQAGTQAQYNSSVKDPDTLYFVTDPNDNTKIILYKGSQEIEGSRKIINQLIDDALSWEHVN